MGLGIEHEGELGARGIEWRLEKGSWGEAVVKCGTRKGDIVA